MRRVPHNCGHWRSSESVLGLRFEVPWQVPGAPREFGAVVPWGAGNFLFQKHTFTQDEAQTILSLPLLFTHLVSHKMPPSRHTSFSFSFRQQTIYTHHVHHAWGGIVECVNIDHRLDAYGIATVGQSSLVAKCETYRVCTHRQQLLLIEAHD